MKVVQLISLLSLFAIVSCQQTENKARYEISGEIINDYEGYIYLHYLDVIDSALVEEGLFTFEGTVPHVVEASLTPDKGTSADGFYFGNEAMNLTLRQDDRYFFFETVESQTAQLMDSVIEVYSIIVEGNENPNKEVNDFMTKIVMKYPDNQFITEIASEVIGDANMLTLEQSNKLIELIDLKSMVPDYYESMMIAIERMKNLNVGDPFIDFELTDIAGNTVKPSDFTGKYLLVDLWASWCGPCRKANPELIKLYNLYQSKGLEILSLSVDQSESAWKKAVAKDQLPWANVRAEEGLASPIARELGVVFIPFNYLIGPDGNIMQINIDLESVQAEMEKL